MVHSGWWAKDDPWVLSGRDPMLAESTRIWGYQTNYGSYCQFARAQSHQVVPRPKNLTWEQTACYLLCGSTSYRMLMGWTPNTVGKGDVVLVWGASGGLGSMALQIVREMGGRPVASDRRGASTDARQSAPGRKHGSSGQCDKNRRGRPLIGQKHTPCAGFGAVGCRSHSVLRPRGAAWY